MPTSSSPCARIDRRAALNASLQFGHLFKPNQNTMIKVHLCDPARIRTNPYLGVLLHNSRGPKESHVYIHGAPPQIDNLGMWGSQGSPQSDLVRPLFS